MEDKLVLLDFWPSLYGMRVRIALAEKGVQYEAKEENIWLEKSPQLLEMNPVHKKIPVLIHNGKPVCESLNIVHYIDEVWNHNSPLLPSDPYQKAQAMFWADYIDKKIFVLVKQVLKAKGEELEATKKEFIECLKTVEGELGEKRYFGGERLGFVDLVLIPITTRFYSLEVCANLSIDSECPKLIGWPKDAWKSRVWQSHSPTLIRSMVIFCISRRNIGFRVASQNKKKNSIHLRSINLYSSWKEGSTYSFNLIQMNRSSQIRN